MAEDAESTPSKSADSDTAQSAINGDALSGHSSTNSVTPKRSVSSSLFLDDGRKRDISKGSILTSKPTGFNSESSNATAAKCSSSNGTNKETKQSAVSSSSSSIPKTAETLIGTSTAENNKPSGNSIDQPFRTNKKTRKKARVLAQITSNSSIPKTTETCIGTSTVENNKPSGNSIDQPFGTNKKSSSHVLAQINSSSSIAKTTETRIDTSTAENNKSSGNFIDQPFGTNKKASSRVLAQTTKQSLKIDITHTKTSLKTDNFNSSKLKVPEYKVSTVSPSKKSTSLRGHLELSGHAKNQNEADLEDKHRSKIPERISILKNSSRFQGGNVQSQAYHFPKNQENNFPYLNNTHARYPTRNFGSQPMGRTDQSRDDYSQNATYSKNYFSVRHPPRTIQFSRSSNTFTSDKGHSLRDEIEEISSELESECRIFDSNNKLLQLCVTSDFSGDHYKELRSYFRHSPVDSDSSCATNYESKFHHSPRESRFDLKLNYGDKLKETGDAIYHSKYSPRNVSFPTGLVRKVESHKMHGISPKASGDAVSQNGYSTRALYSPRYSEGRAHFRYNPWIHNSGESRVDSTPGRYPKTSYSVQCHPEYSPQNLHCHTGSGGSAESYQFHRTLEDVISDIGCSFTTLNSHASKNAETHKKGFLYPNTADVISKQEFSPIGSKRKGKIYEDHPRTIIFQDTSNVSDNLQSVEPFKEKSKTDVRSYEPYVPQTLPNDTYLTQTRENILHVPQPQQNELNVHQPWPHELSSHQRWTMFPEQRPNESHSLQKGMNEPPASLSTPYDQPASLSSHDEPPAFQPYVDEPPAFQPYVDEPPAFQPYVDEPPVFQPYVDEPSVFQPYVDEPPTFQPSMIEPPFRHSFLKEPNVRYQGSHSPLYMPPPCYAVQLPPATQNVPRLPQAIQNDRQIPPPPTWPFTPQQPLQIRPFFLQQQPRFQPFFSPQPLQIMSLPTKGRPHVFHLPPSSRPHFPQ